MYDFLSSTHDLSISFYLILSHLNAYNLSRPPGMHHNINVNISRVSLLYVHILLFVYVNFI